MNSVDALLQDVDDIISDQPAEKKNEEKALTTQKASSSNSFSKDDFVKVEKESSEGEPVVVGNPGDQVEEVRDPSPQVKLFLSSDQGEELTKKESMEDFISEDYRENELEETVKLKFD